MPASIPSYVFFIFFAITIAAIYAIVVVYSYERKRKARALRSLHSVNKSASNEEQVSGFAEFSRELLQMFGINVEKKWKENYGLYGQAGFYTEDAVSKFLFYRYLIQPIFLFIGAIILLLVLTGSSNLAELETLGKLLTGFIFALFGISGHNMVLDKLAKKRKEKLVQEFPDAVDLMLICIESGMGLDSGLSRVSKELQMTHKNVTAELERTRVELGLFGDRVQALQNLAERTDIQSYRSLVSALVQSERYGTNLAATLRTLSKEYRDQRLLKAEEKAAKVSALLTLPVVIGVFFPVMALIMAPVVIKLMHSGL